ncbi:McrB family protein [Actinoplanes sp. NPDC051513]|uniref:McrB family protein n=1 Tax=Actinoplanes sp. NPDC051513 TaxID=3363908 RepID=UPI0037BD94E1
MNGQQPSVWWVNQGSTYGKARNSGVIWAPKLNKAGRTERHWETMRDVSGGDIILHYSNGSLRAIGTAEGPASDAANPFESDEWEQDGRLVQVHYEDLGSPVPLASIPAAVRIPASGPFTSVGSVQQGYLYKVGEALLNVLVRDFPEFGAAMPWYEPTETTSTASDIDLATVQQNFAAAVEESGLAFASGGNFVRAFLSGILAKPFAILTGLSGSGKTQLAMRLGDWLGRDAGGRPRYLVVPVRPDWTGPEALLGYEDALRSAEAKTPVWFVPEALQLILRAVDDPTAPYLLILDEMNLAHVERYFADFLSGTESRQPILPDLVRRDEDLSWEVRSVPGERLPLPRNLFVVGTVNVDETTYMFSPKVLDRAFTFEFRVEADALDPDRGRPVPAAAASEEIVRQVCALAEDDGWHHTHPYEYREQLVEALRGVHRLLADVSFEFGHRTMYESLRFAAIYAASSSSTPSIDEVFDLILMQKILPRLHGSRRRLEPLLVELQTRANGDESVRWPLTHSKVGRMLEVLRANQFVSFAE